MPAISVVSFRGLCYFEIMKYNFCFYGHPVLRRPADPVTRVDGAVRDLGRDLLVIMAERNGVGLAAQQIGLTIRICAVGFDPRHDVAGPGGPRLNPEVILPLVLVNPEITARAGGQTEDEGCLSVPEIWAPVHRAWEVTVRYLDLQGEPRMLSARGLLARAIQHELDHLNGMLFVDRVSAVKKITLKNRLKRLERKTAAELGLDV